MILGWLVTLVFVVAAAAPPGATSASRSNVPNHQPAGALAGRAKPLKGTIALTGWTSAGPGGTSRVYLLHLATRKLTPVRNSQGYEASAWSPDGSRLLVSKCGHPCVGLYSMRADGSSTVVLTTRANTFSGDARWSPTGNRVAFEDSSGQLWVVGADGSQLRLLASDLMVTGYVGGNFSWAPNGKRIVFARNDGRLFTVTTQGIPTLRRINYSPVVGEPVALQPTWSPDGSHIAFSDDAGVGPGYSVPDSIVVMRADGSDVHVLHHGHDPIWSPNGAWIAGRTSGPDQCCSGYALTMHADGTRAQTWLAGGETFAPGGSRLAYEGFFFANQPDDNLYVANADGSHRVRVLHHPGLFLGGPGGPLWRGGTARG